MLGAIASALAGSAAQALVKGRRPGSTEWASLAGEIVRILVGSAPDHATRQQLARIEAKLDHVARQPYEIAIRAGFARLRDTLPAHRSEQQRSDFLRSANERFVDAAAAAEHDNDPGGQALATYYQGITWFLGQSLEDARDTLARSAELAFDAVVAHVAAANDPPNDLVHAESMKNQDAFDRIYRSFSITQDQAVRQAARARIAGEALGRAQTALTLLGGIQATRARLVPTPAGYATPQVDPATKPAAHNPSLRFRLVFELSRAGVTPHLGLQVDDAVVRTGGAGGRSAIDVKFTVEALSRDLRLGLTANAPGFQPRTDLPSTAEAPLLGPSILANGAATCTWLVMPAGRRSTGWLRLSGPRTSNSLEVRYDAPSGSGKSVAVIVRAEIAPRALPAPTPPPQLPPPPPKLPAPKASAPKAYTPKTSAAKAPAAVPAPPPPAPKAAVTRSLEMRCVKCHWKFRYGAGTPHVQCPNCRCWQETR